MLRLVQVRSRHKAKAAGLETAHVVGVFFLRSNGSNGCDQVSLGSTIVAVNEVWRPQLLVHSL